MSRIYGYARCSTTTQSTDAQVEALKTAGCTKVFAEKVSSRTPEHQRIQLQAALSVLEEGDELVLSKLDRIGRTMFEVVTRLHDLQTRGDPCPHTGRTPEYEGTGEDGTTGRRDADGTGRGRTQPYTRENTGVRRSPQTHRREPGRQTWTIRGKEGQYCPSTG